MKIGILGAGTVAKTLGAAWVAKNHSVFIGSRDAQSETLVAWQQATAPTIRLGSLRDAAAYGDVILLAINPWTAIESVVTSLGNELAGKTVIDVSNNIQFGQTVAMAFTDRSMGEAIQAWLPKAHVVKTLNVTPAPMMIQPMQSGINPAIGWVAGNNAVAKSQVSTLVEELGWSSVVDLGDISASRLQESIGLTLSVIVTNAIASKSNS